MPPPGQTEPRRRIGLTSATALVVANMIGAGIFTTSGFALADLGTPTRVLLAWTVGGALAVCGALSYGALARRISESGGEYVFLSRTIHPLAGFLAGWVSLTAGFTAPIALAAAALEAYCKPLVPEGWPLPLIGTTAIVLAGLLHGLRLAHGVRSQNVVVMIKLALLVGVVMYGVPRLQAHPPPATPPDFSLPAFCASLVWISLSYSGWNAAVYIGGEVRDPARKLPRSLLLGTIIVAIFYLLLNALFVHAAPVDQLAGKEDIAAAAARALGGAQLEGFVRAIVAVALCTSISAMVMAGPRVYAKMAEDGLFPRFFAMRDEVPGRAVALQCALAIAVLWPTNLRELLTYAGWTLSISAACTVLGLVRLRIREGEHGLRVPGWPWVPAVFVLATFGAGAFVMQHRPWEPLAGVLTIAVGLILYLLLKRKRNSRTSSPTFFKTSGKF